MGNHKMEHHRPWINTASLTMSKAAIVETWRQHAGVGVIQSLDTCITTTWMEMVVAPNMDVVRRGVLIGSITKLGSGSSKIKV
jgi:cell shape-determining protein MreC